ncbi:glycoside hydrolase family protein [Streptomyces sp. NPDC054784]
MTPALSRRRFLGGAAALGAATAAGAALATTSESTASAGAPRAAAAGGKGVSATSFQGASAALTDVGASWYYNWASGTGDVTRPEGVEFVPMIWGADSVNADDLGKAAREGEQLLGFNEPDMAGQANMPASRALELWPQLEGTGMRLGAPAVAYGADQPGSWFEQFMSGANDRGLRVDFIPLHWYGADFGPDAVDHLRGYLEATHERWNKPIWLTEYALTDFTGSSPRYPSEGEQTAFVSAVVPMLNSLDFVERHAWFTLSTEASPTGLHSGGSLNATGRAYRDAPA